MAIVSVSGKIGSGKDTVGKIIQLLSENYNDSDIIKIINNDLSEWRDETKNRQWQIKKFAGKIKETVALWLGVTIEQLEDREFKEKPLGEEWWYHLVDGEMISYKSYPDSSEPWYGDDNIVKLTPRKLMQLVGTEAGREILHPNIWVNSLFADYMPSSEKPFESLSDKLLFHESKWIITDTRFPNEAKAVRDRNGILIRVSRPYKSDMHGNHASETALDDWNDWDYIIHNNGSLDDLLHKVKEIYEHIK